MEFDVPVTVAISWAPIMGSSSEVPKCWLSTNRTTLRLISIRSRLREQMILNSIGPVNGRRRYQGEVTVDGRSVQVVFTPYADCGGDGTRFRTAFPK